MSKARLAISHREDDGSGCLLSVEFHYQTDERPAYLRFSFANQKDEGFDSANPIVCDLGFDPLMRMLTVLRGEAETPNGGKPLQSAGGAKVAIRGLEGGRFALAAMDDRGFSPVRSQILLERHEATGLRVSIESSMFFFSFIRGITP